jgi:hypothetical protein
VVGEFAHICLSVRTSDQVGGGALDTREATLVASWSLGDMRRLAHALGVRHRSRTGARRAWIGCHAHGPSLLRRRQSLGTRIARHRSKPDDEEECAPGDAPDERTRSPKACGVKPGESPRGSGCSLAGAAGSGGCHLPPESYGASLTDMQRTVADLICARQLACRLIAERFRSARPSAERRDGRRHRGPRSAPGARYRVPRIVPCSVLNRSRRRKGS